MRKFAASLLLTVAFAIGLSLGMGPADAQARWECIYLCNTSTGEITKCCKYPVIGWICTPQPGDCR